MWQFWWLWLWRDQRYVWLVLWLTLKDLCIFNEYAWQWELLWSQILKEIKLQDWKGTEVEELISWKGQKWSNKETVSSLGKELLRSNRTRANNRENPPLPSFDIHKLASPLRLALYLVCLYSRSHCLLTYQHNELPQLPMFSIYPLLFLFIRKFVWESVSSYRRIWLRTQK